MKTKSKFLISVIAMLSVVGMTAACTPPASDGKLPAVNWAFKGTQVKVIESQDCTIGFINCKDEPYLLNVNFRVKIGKSNSAETWVVNGRNAAPQDVAPGTTVQVTEAGAPSFFNGVRPVDLLDLTNPSNKLEIVGTYVWASEEDFVGNGLAANSVANVLKDGLNATLATSDITGLDANTILDLVLSNIGSAFNILIQNIPLLGLGDDVLGGGIYIGIGARGALGDAMNGLLGGVAVPTIDIPVALPPSITGGGIYTFAGGTKTFTQTFTGAGGKHEWTMTAGKA